MAVCEHGRKIFFITRTDVLSFHVRGRSTGGFRLTGHRIVSDGHNAVAQQVTRIRGASVEKREPLLIVSLNQFRTEPTDSRG
jgi:hypothetical protein